MPGHEILEQKALAHAIAEFNAAGIDIYGGISGHGKYGIIFLNFDPLPYHRGRGGVVTHFFRLSAPSGRRFFDVIELTVEGEGTPLKARFTADGYAMVDLMGGKRYDLRLKLVSEPAEVLLAQALSRAMSDFVVSDETVGPGIITGAEDVIMAAYEIKTSARGFQVRFFIPGIRFAEVRMKRTSKGTRTNRKTSLAGGNSFEVFVPTGTYAITLKLISNLDEAWRFE